MEVLRLKLNKLNYHTIKALEISIAVLIGLIILLSGIWTFRKYFEHKIYPFISIESESLTAKSPSQALRHLQSQTITSNSVTTLAYNDNFKEFSLNELGIQFDLAGSIADAYRVGREVNYFNATRQIDLRVNIDQKKFNQAVAGMDKSIIKPVQDAYITTEEGEIKIVPEDSGLGVDMEEFRSDLKSVIFKNSQIVRLSVKESVPILFSQDLAATRERAQDLVGQDYSFIYNNKIFTPSKAQKVQWLDFKGDKIVFSDEGVNEYLDYLASKIEVKSIPKRIYEDGTVEQDGQDGLELDRKKTLVNIKSALLEGGSSQIVLEAKVVSRKVVKVNRPFTPGLYEGKYIEIDLSSQMLYQMEGKNMAGSHLVSSGKAGMDTPVGIFRVNSKNIKAYSASHNLYMPYWMAFIGGKYGMHELPEWANGYKEGQDHLGIPVSHGCVRLGVGDAAQVYQWTDVGTPVYIHK